MITNKSVSKTATMSQPSQPAKPASPGKPAGKPSTKKK